MADNENKQAPCTTWRSDTEILKEMIDEIMEYNSLRDDEWDFMDEHGHPDMWNAETIDEHDQLLGEIQAHRGHIRDLIVEATGDKKVCF